jgi:L-fuculose-phosphate aldolase
MQIEEQAREKDYYHRQTAQRMAEHLLTPQWPLREKVAIACRILAQEGHESALAGQITARADVPGTYWMLSFGLGFEEARKSNIIRVDGDLNVLEGDGMPNPSNRFHLWIYARRPEINAIIHTHPPHVSALSMIGEPLVPSHMDTMMFYEDCAYLPEWPGVPIGDEEGRIISEAIGTKR